MGTLHEFWANQPPGAAPRGPLCHLFPNLQLLWNGAAHTHDASGSGSIANVGTPANLSVSRDLAGTGISTGSASGAFISFSGKASGTQNRVTFFGIVKPDLVGTTQILLLSSATTTGHMIKIDTSNNLTLSKPGITDYASISLTDKETVAFIGSHNEVTDAYWLMVRSLQTGIIRSTSGTDASTAGSCDGSVCIQGRTDGASSSTSPLMMGGIAFDYLPQALGYAFLDTPWQVFARPSSGRAAAAAAAFVFNPLSGRGGAAAQPLVIH